MRRYFILFSVVISLFACTPSSELSNSPAIIKPVLIAIANEGFYYQEYADPRLALESNGLSVIVSAGTNSTAIPHVNTGQPTGQSGNTEIDIAFSEVNVSDYSALVISGGWGATRYYYAFNGTLNDSNWEPHPTYATQINTLIETFLSQNKSVLGVCNGVNVLSWARINGYSPLSNKTVCAPTLLTPGLSYLGTNHSGGLYMYIFAQDNGGYVLPYNSVGDPGSNTDDVAVDGLIMTAQDNFSAYRGGQLLAERLLGD